MLYSRTQKTEIKHNNSKGSRSLEQSKRGKREGLKDGQGVNIDHNIPWQSTVTRYRVTIRAGYIMEHILLPSDIYILL